MTTRNLVLFCVAMLGGLVSIAARERMARARVFGEALALIESAALHRADGDELLDAALDAAVARLDEHSAFLRGAGRAELESALDQQVAGIGLELVLDETNREPIVVTPLPASPAWRAGIVAGDRIEAVDGEPTRGRPLRDVVQRLRGRVGTPVTLRLSRGAGVSSLDPRAAGPREIRELSLVREIVQLETVLGDRRRADGSWEWFVEGEPGVALVRLEGFGERTADELGTALRAVAAAGGVRGLVVDLRGNPGGLLNVARDLASRFLESGPVVWTKQRQGEMESLDVDPSKHRGRLHTGAYPVVVLVNGGSASASEIVSGAIQDGGVGFLLGTRTFGKGLVQTILPLGERTGALKITTQQYFTRAKNDINLKRDEDGNPVGGSGGIRPDKIVVESEKDIEAQRKVMRENPGNRRLVAQISPQVKEAVKLLKDRLDGKPFPDSEKDKADKQNDAAKKEDGD